MLKKQFHQTYMAQVEELLNNFKYLMEYNNKAKQSITVKQGNEVIALLLPSDAVVEFDKSIEKLEEQHKLDQKLNKELKKQNEILETRLKLQSKTNNSNINNGDFPFN